MTKQEVFRLYVDNDNVEVQYRIDGKDGFQYDNFDQYLGDGSGETEAQIMTYCGDVVPISQCQLILKRISDMGEQDRLQFCAILGVGKEEFAGLIETESTDIGDCTQVVFCRGVIATLWLIQHGYALSEDWFTNGIAVEASQIAEKEEK